MPPHRAPRICHEASWLIPVCLLGCPCTPGLADSAVGTASATIIGLTPVMSVLDLHPVAVNPQSRTVLFQLGSVWLHVPQGANAYALSAPDVIWRAALQTQREPGLLQPGMNAYLTAHMPILDVPLKAHPSVPEILVEFN